MKKIFALLLVTAMLLSLAACGGDTLENNSQQGTSSTPASSVEDASSQDTTSTEGTSSQDTTSAESPSTNEGGSSGGTNSQVSSESGFEAPADYAAIVEVTLKHTMKLYLNGQTDVLAIDYVTEEAKSWYSPFENHLIGEDCGDCIENLIDMTSDMSPAVFGNIEKIKVNVAAALDTVDKSALLGSVAEDINEYLADKNITKAVAYEIGGKDKTADFAGGAQTTPEIVNGEDYYIIKPVEDPEILRYDFEFDFSTGMCDYAEGLYSYEYGDPDDTMEYGGKTYMQAGGRGGSANFSISGDVCTVTEIDGDAYLKFKIGADGSLTVTENNGFLAEGMAPVEVGDKFVKE